MFNYPYILELLSPKRSSDDQIEVLLDRFAKRYRRIMDAGCGISIPDNPMGQPRVSALESLAKKPFDRFRKSRDESEHVPYQKRA